MPHKIPPTGQAPSPDIPRRTIDYVRALSACVDAKGDYFPGHSDAVGYLVTLYATELDVQEPLLSELHVAAMLHDTGKIRVADSILLAPRSLTDDEWKIMRQHSVWSSEITASIGGLEHLVSWVRHHHEHWDGSGYPDGLKGEEIPWQSRLLLIADAFHVMTAHRPYRRAMTRVEALTVLHNCSGKQFDPGFIDNALARPPVVTQRESMSDAVQVSSRRRRLA